MKFADRGSRILEAAEHLLQGTGFEVVDVEAVGSSRGLVVRVFVDKPDGVTIDDCARISRALADEIEAVGLLDGRYVLEVSSPGIDRPLRRPADYERFAGETAEVSTFEKIEGRHKHRGRLDGFDREHESVLIRGEDGSALAIPLGAVRRAHLVRDPWERERKQNDESGRKARSGKRNR